MVVVVVLVVVVEQAGKLVAEQLPVHVVRAVGASRRRHHRKRKLSRVMCHQRYLLLVSRLRLNNSPFSTGGWRLLDRKRQRGLLQGFVSQ